VFKCLLACLHPEYIHESVVLPIVVIGDDKNDDDDDDNDNDEDDCEDDADDDAAANDDNTFKRVSYVLIFRVFFFICVPFIRSQYVLYYIFFKVYFYFQECDYYKTTWRKQVMLFKRTNYLGAVEVYTNLA